MKEPDVVRISQLQVAGWYRESTPEAYSTDLREFWSQAPEYLPAIPNADLQTTLVVTSDWFDDSKPMSILCGAEVTGHPRSKDFVTRTIPEATYAVFQLDGRIPRVSEDWDSIWSRLDKGDLIWTKNYSIRRYHHGPGIADICIPLDQAGT